ncbi:MAG TPA: hypothetical protein VMV18_00200, partial [bacterium]|nr:hypothetical protein [bacterium]
MVLGGNHADFVPSTAARHKYLARGAGSTVFLTASDAWVVLEGQTQDVALRLAVSGSVPRPTLSASGLLPAKSNYFIGSSETKWRTGIPQYSSVAYQGVAPGVD